jgi:hypothetical protein
MDVFTTHMAASLRTQIADNMRNAVAGIPIDTLAKAADTDPRTLTARLEGRDELTVADLIAVGGFLHVNPAVFLEGANE